MRIQTLYARLLVAGVSLFLANGVLAQNNAAIGSPGAASVGSKESTAPPVQPAVVTDTRPRAATPAVATQPASVTPFASMTGHFDQSLLLAIQSHLGATYHFNRTGPGEFDCSGLVWRAFQDAGVVFERGPARSYWATFAAPPKNEEFKFGTLVFFNNLRHVGIVVDEKGFYHSARHGGVMYSPFNEYWLSRIDGFRRVPIGPLPSPAAASKINPPKPAATIAAVEPK